MIATQISTAPTNALRPNWSRRIESAIANEAELLIAPELFGDSAGAIRHDSWGRFCESSAGATPSTSLPEFRYDVVLFKPGAKTTDLTGVLTLRWGLELSDSSELRATQSFVKAGAARCA